MSKKTCKLCNRTFSHSYKLFGRGCFNTECNLLKISIPKDEIDKEKYFVNEVARRLNRYGISQKKKYELIEKYLTLEYLKKIKYGDLSKEKKHLENEINNISFKNSVKETIDKLLDNDISNTLDVLVPGITLNKAYRLYKNTLKYEKKMKELNKSDNNEGKVLETMGFIFDASKITNPIEYKVFYGMQYAFWSFGVEYGKRNNLKIASELLAHSLVATEKDSQYYKLINEEDSISKIKNSSEFKQKVDELIKRYSGHKRKIEINSQTVNTNNEFIVMLREDEDLWFAFHNCTINVSGIKNESNKWKLHITMFDTYDFTDWKKLEEYKESYFGNTLNNFGVVSMKYGVLKPYNIKIEFDIIK